MWETKEQVRRENGNHYPLTDIIMPGMGGKELRDRIIERRPEIPVLFSSGYGISEIDAGEEPHSTIEIIHKP